ncbi:hypothetical protein PAPYR_8160 [Paratrimastix pyriformis]|uniref:Protein kinase domain-containing protein n=1 Tax=Paratrimastix pyriformis TaxID=342808 RepID=A0ABQ8UDZ7_9EUKA|nr:hypothetical protein PAPYR_8160 [Paratrimastix pyriformis]
MFRDVYMIRELARHSFKAALKLGAVRSDVFSPDWAHSKLVEEIATRFDEYPEFQIFPGYLRRELELQSLEHDRDESLDEILAAMRKHQPSATPEELFGLIRCASNLDSFLMNLTTRFRLSTRRGKRLLINFAEVDRMFHRGECRMRLLRSGPEFDAFVSGLGECLSTNDARILIDNARIMLTPDDFIRNAPHLRDKTNDGLLLCIMRALFSHEHHEMDPRGALPMIRSYLLHDKEKISAAQSPKSPVGDSFEAVLEPDGKPCLCLAMPFSEYGDLNRVILRGTTPSERHHIARALLDGLRSLHENPIPPFTEPVLHRDLHPGNVVMRRNQATGELEPLVTDQALTCQFTHEDITIGGPVPGTRPPLVGTPGFRAPELTTTGYTVATDVYAMGCTLWCLFTGNDTTHRTDRPLERDEVARAFHEVPEPARELLVRMCARDPRERPTASALCEALDAVPAPPPEADAAVSLPSGKAELRACLGPTAAARPISGSDLRNWALQLAATRTPVPAATYFARALVALLESQRTVGPPTTLIYCLRVIAELCAPNREGAPAARSALADAPRLVVELLLRQPFDPDIGIPLLRALDNLAFNNPANTTSFLGAQAVAPLLRILESTGSHALSHAFIGALSTLVANNAELQEALWPANIPVSLYNAVSPPVTVLRSITCETSAQMPFLDLLRCCYPEVPLAALNPVLCARLLRIKERAPCTHAQRPDKIRLQWHCTHGHQDTALVFPLDFAALPPPDRVARNRTTRLWDVPLGAPALCFACLMQGRPIEEHRVRPTLLCGECHNTMEATLPEGTTLPNPLPHNQLDATDPDPELVPQSAWPGAPLDMLLTTASPPDHEELREVAAKAKAIELEYRSRFDLRLRIRYLPRATKESLRAAIAARRPTLLVTLTHGDWEHLFLHHPDQPTPLAPRPRPQQLKVGALLACKSGQLGLALKHTGHVPHVLATHDNLEESEAVRFLSTFVTHLAESGLKGPPDGLGPIDRLAEAAREEAHREYPHLCPLMVTPEEWAAFEQPPPPPNHEALGKIMHRTTTS